MVRLCFATKQSDVLVLFSELAHLQEWREGDQLTPTIEKKIGASPERASLRNPSKQQKPLVLDFLPLEMHEAHLECK